MREIIFASAIVSSLLLNGCGGGGGGSETSFNLNENPIKMETNKTYTLKAGQTIQKKSSDAKVSLITNFEDNTTKAILRSGECWIE